MNIPKKDWLKFTRASAKINKASQRAMQKYINRYGLDDVDELVRYGHEITSLYGTASASLSASMYDEIVALENKAFAAAELAPNPAFGEVSEAIQGVLKRSVNPGEISGAVSRLVKRTGQDTLLQNGKRDHAEFAWVPFGDSCPFCIMLASAGWQPISSQAIKGGHAEHIHANCDCSYSIRHVSDFGISGYNPQVYLDEYQSAEGRTSADKINSMRRMQYAEHKDIINAQKRAAYALRTSAEE